MVVAGGDDGPVPRTDLLAIVASVVLVVAIVFTPLGEVRPFALVVGLPFVLLGPGYALVSVVFPRAGETGAGSEMSWLARLVLSVAGSVVAVAVVGIALDFTVWGFQRGAVVGSLSALTLAATVLAWYRRRVSSRSAKATTRVSGWLVKAGMW